MRSLDIVVIGGGAAGFFGAIACAENFPHCRVKILERGQHVLTKVRISGGGRCNVTHACYDPKTLITHYPRGGRELLGPFHKFQPRNTVEWFEKRGTLLKTEEDGRIFPVTDTSLTIINALKDAAQAARVKVDTGNLIESVTREQAGRFSIALKNGETFACDRLLLATGSNPQGFEWARKMGHAIESPVPSLFTFGIPDERLRGLAGISVDKVELEITGTPLRQTGPILITHWGVSGPAVLKLSAWGARALHDMNYNAQLRINWLCLNPEKIQRRLLDYKNENPRKLVGTNSPFQLPQRLWERLVFNPAAPQQRWADVSSIHLRRMTDSLSAGAYAIRGKSAFKEEFVTCGGVRLDEVNFQTMESKICPGLYFAGEILDIDGVTGGFNFQSAWTTSWIAGQAMGF